MRDLETTDATILTLKESIRLDDLALENPECTTDHALAVRLHKAGCVTELQNSGSIAFGSSRLDLIQASRKEKKAGRVWHAHGPL